MGRPLISIVTVCLNEAATLRSTCESICSQTYRDFQWIVVDGGSTDGSHDILSEYRDRIDRLVSEPDNGIYDAMNKGIRQSEGLYLLFLNAGDCLADKHVLEHFSGHLDADLVYGDLLFRSTGEEEYIRSFPDRLPENFLLHHMMPHQATFIRQSLFDRFGLYDDSYRIAADYDLFARLLCVHKVSSRHVPKVVSVFNFSGVSSNPSHRDLRRAENHAIRKRYFPWYVYGVAGLKHEIRLFFEKVGWKGQA